MAKDEKAASADEPDVAPVNGSPVGDNTEKDPNEWVTGDEPMTGAQASYLKTLSDEAGEEMNVDLTKAEASQDAAHKADRLVARTDRSIGQRDSARSARFFNVFVLRAFNARSWSVSGSNEPGPETTRSLIDTSVVAPI
jgi:hypothetical protein